MLLKERETMDSKLVTIVKAIFAGIAIGLAGIIYLKLDNNILGAALFSFGLMIVCAYSLNLYTGKIGYILVEDKKYILKILLIILGNVIGIGFIALMAYIIHDDTIIENARAISTIKLDNVWYKTLVLSILCGMMMHIGVDGYKTVKNDFAKVLIVIGAVMIFILAKFEHSIANLLYFMLAGWTWKTLLYVVIMLVGNAIGGMLICMLNVVISKNKKIETEEKK